MKNSITDKIKTLEDVYKITKPDKEQLILINYKGKNQQLIGAKNFMLAEMIATTLNEKTKLNWGDSSQEKWFGYYNPGSGFYCSLYYFWYSDSTVSSRLHFKSVGLFWHAVQTFPEIYKNLMEK